MGIEVVFPLGEADACLAFTWIKLRQTQCVSRSLWGTPIHLPFIHSFIASASSNWIAYYARCQGF